MSMDPLAGASGKILFTILLFLCAMVSSCSTVSSFLSDLDKAAFSAGESTRDRKIPLPPMAEDYGRGDGESPPLSDGDR
jgi:hypothetical protein